MNREAFEAWYKNNFGEPDFLRGACGTYYMNSSVDFAWRTWQAAIASQAQQPNYKLNELAQMIMSDCGVSTINNDALFNRILDRLINASDLQIRPDVLCGGCKGIRSSDCPDCNGSGKMTDPRTQAQQESQWISVEERLPEGDVFVDVYIRSRSNTNFMQRETSVAFVSGKFKINRIFDCEYVSHWMPIPPAPEGGEKSSCRQCGAPSGNSHCLGDIWNCSDLAAPEVTLTTNNEGN